VSFFNVSSFGDFNNWVAARRISLPDPQIFVHFVNVEEKNSFGFREGTKPLFFEGEKVYKVPPT